MKILIDVKKTGNLSEPYRLKVTVPVVKGGTEECEIGCISLDGAIDGVINEMTKHRTQLIEVAIEGFKPKPAKKPPTGKK